MAVSNIPPFFNMDFTNKDGSLTPNAQLYNDQLCQSLQQIIEQMNNGIQLPQKTTAEITVYRDDINVPRGTIWFNTSLLKLQFKTVANIGSGTIETITSV